MDEVYDVIVLGTGLKVRYGFMIRHLHILVYRPPIYTAGLNVNWRRGRRNISSPNPSSK